MYRVLVCLLLPVLTWSETFFELVKEANAATVQVAVGVGSNLEARTKNGWTSLMFTADYNENSPPR